MGIITLQEAKDWMGITATGTDAIIQTYIDVTTQEIESYIDNKICPEDISNEILTINISNFDQQVANGIDIEGYAVKVMTRYNPIVTASGMTISYQGVELTEGSGTTNNDYRVDYKTGVINFTKSVSSDNQQLVASYTAGYSTIPADLKLVAYQGVKAYFEAGGQAKQGQGNVKSKKVGDFSVSYGNSEQTTEGTLQKVYLSSNSHILNRYMRYSI